MKDLLSEGFRLSESLARLPWEAARRMAGDSETLRKAADLGESLGTLPFRHARRVLDLTGPAPSAHGTGTPAESPLTRPAGEGFATPGTGAPGDGPAAERPGGPAPMEGAEPSEILGQKGRILVLGAGYGGLTCFLELQDHLSREYDLVLINGDRYHWFTTELHTYVAGESEEAVRIPLSRVVSRPGRLIIGKVTRLHPEEQLVELSDGQRIRYDKLVFGLGSEPEYFGLPGVAQYGMIIGTAKGAGQVRERIRNMLADQQEAEHIPHVAVAGGGLTGVEVVSELAEQYPGRVRLSLLEAGPEIMAGFTPDLVRTSRDVLTGMGVALHCGNPIAAVDEEQITFKNGDQMDYDLLVWAGGVRGSHILAESGLETTPRGRAKADAFLRAVGHEEIYMVGDSAAVKDQTTGKEVAPTAQFAVQMGKTAARNILRSLRGQPEEPFVPVNRGSFASLGRKEGVGVMGQEHFSGPSALLIKSMIEAHHAWESGAGVSPLIAKLTRFPGRFLQRHRPRRILVPAPATRPESTQQRTIPH
ncbi:MAG: NAD(P)/FAD-dependent oxidoreductase [Mycobacterium leprae]